MIAMSLVGQYLVKAPREQGEDAEPVVQPPHANPNWQPCRVRTSCVRTLNRCAAIGTTPGGAEPDYGVLKAARCHLIRPLSTDGRT